MLSSKTLKKAALGSAAFLLMGAAGLFALGSTTANANTSLATNCDVVIYEYGHNAPGTDTSANRNSEFVRLVNTGSTEVDVEGWWIQDTYPHTFKLEANGPKALPTGSPFRKELGDAGNAGDHFVMPVGSSVYLYNGSGVDSQPTNNSAAIYRNTTHHFNNSGETIYFKRSDGKTMSFVQFTSFREKIGPTSCTP